LKEIQAAKNLTKFRMRGLFADQDSSTVQKVIDDHSRLNSGGEVVIGDKGAASCIALTSRLELTALLAEYRKQARALTP
jgi:hypothetical protein